MAFFRFIAIFTMLCIINTTIAFKCWCCSSDETAFCGKFLDESNLSVYEKDVYLVECPYPHYKKGHDIITKCKIQKALNNGRTIYTRSCIWEERDAKQDDCLSGDPPHGHRIQECETCLQDKCNNKMKADIYSSGSTHLTALYQIMFVCFVIVLNI